jgi:hypothetical protein
MTRHLPLHDAFSFHNSNGRFFLLFDNEANNSSHKTFYTSFEEAGPWSSLQPPVV